MNASKFAPIDPDRLDKKANVLARRADSSFLGFSRAAVTQHYINVQDSKDRKESPQPERRGLRGWMANIAKAFSS